MTGRLSRVALHQQHREFPRVASALGVERSMRRCPRTPPPFASSGIVMNAVVVDGRAFGLAIPERDRPPGPGLEDDLSNGVADHLGDAPPGPRSGLAQSLEFFLAKVNLRLFHVCHFRLSSDIRQDAAVPPSSRSCPAPHSACIPAIFTFSPHISSCAFTIARNATGSLRARAKSCASLGPITLDVIQFSGRC